MSEKRKNARWNKLGRFFIENRRQDGHPRLTARTVLSFLVNMRYNEQK
ncbi:hypothetical protein HOLDEFILI_02744 [Holdemania filiformis DSM 12042]|uniref:Uncharacterized protein n=1 Tax=Holdemania filiformis DSM 12042 TaxID=545696 RepID=B9YA87_9FIRM|nr:hypothetical protein HOLDEFILI_02744 [Holdemania filiformis DSM 12042]